MYERHALLGNVYGRHINKYSSGFVLMPIKTDGVGDGLLLRRTLLFGSLVRIRTFARGLFNDQLYPTNARVTPIDRV